MAKKIVELSSKKKVELKEMSIDDIDVCNDMTVLRTDDKGETYIVGLSKARTAWLRRGIAGGDFKGFKLDADGLVPDKVMKQLSDDDKNELVIKIQEHQSLGE